MKLSNLLLFAGAAAGSYLVTKNRQTITDEVLNTTDRVQAIKDDVDIIQNSLQIIEQQKELIKEYQEDQTYKFKVLEKDIQTRLAVIKETQEIDQNTDDQIPPVKNLPFPLTFGAKLPDFFLLQRICRNVDTHEHSILIPVPLPIGILADQYNKKICDQKNKKQSYFHFSSLSSTRIITDNFYAKKYCLYLYIH